MEQFSTWWIKCKTTWPGLNMKKIDEFRPDWRQNLAESDKGSWFNQLSVSEEACASSLHVSAVSKKKIGAKKAEESHVTRERLPRTRPDYSSSSDSSLSESSAFLKHRRGTCPLFVSVLWKYVLYLSLCVFVDHGLNVCAWNVTETL